jgi:hypothetical protein
METKLIRLGFVGFELTLLLRQSKEWLFLAGFAAKRDSRKCVFLNDE